MNQAHNIELRHHKRDASQMMSSSTEEMKVSLSVDTENNDCAHCNCGDGDLRKHYQDAVDCLTHCESVLQTLDAQLAAKDKHIASLEEKLVQMSLELASSKAFEDEHRSKRRASTSDEAEAEELPPPPTRTYQINKRKVPRARSMDLGSVVDQENCVDGTNTQRGRHRSMILPLGISSLAAELDCGTSRCSSHRGSFTSRCSSSALSFMGGGEAGGDESSANSLSNLGQLLFHKSFSEVEAVGEESSANSLSSLGQMLFRKSFSGVEESTDSLHEDFPKDNDDPLLDESSASRSLSNLGQLFRRSRTREPKQEEEEVPEVEENGKEEEWDGRPRRRAPGSRKRREHQASSRSFLSAVLFPVSSDDCIKGCDVRKSITKGPWQGGANQQWQEFQ